MAQIDNARFFHACARAPSILDGIVKLSGAEACVPLHRCRPRLQATSHIVRSNENRIYLYLTRHWMTIKALSFPFQIKIIDIIVFFASLLQSFFVSSLPQYFFFLSQETPRKRHVRYACSMNSCLHAVQ